MSARAFTVVLLTPAAVVFTTPKGRPVATARVENGKAFLFTSPNCEED